MKELIINVEKLETRVALLEEGRLEEFSIERSDRERLAGSIFKGRVHNLEEGLQAAFVDIGAGKNAFLHFWDMEPRTEEDIDDLDGMDGTPGPEEPEAGAEEPVESAPSDVAGAPVERGEESDPEPSSQELTPPAEEAPADPAPAARAEVGAGAAVRAVAVVLPRAMRGRNRGVRMAPAPVPAAQPPVPEPIAESLPDAEAEAASAPEEAWRPAERGRRGRAPGHARQQRGVGRPGNGGRVRRQARHELSTEEIVKRYPPGSEILVQVTKGPIGSKGARVTTNLSIPGRYLVLLPNSRLVGVSRKIADEGERERLKRALRRLEIPAGMGVIVRTVGQGQDLKTFQTDLAMLLRAWAEVAERIETGPAPSCVYREPDLIERTIRDYMTDELDRIVIDSPDDFERVRGIVGQVAGRQARNKVKLYTENRPVFERFHVERQIENAFRRRVWLPSGGYVVIDETEALVAIDVNTGRHKGGKDQGTTALEVNLEAGEEIARQLRLRNIGGLIVIDFIDMRSRKDQQSVVRRLREAVKRDRAKVRIFSMSALGLVEMTRQRVEESIRSAIFMDCPHCEGRGLVKSTVSMSVEIQRKLSEVLRRHTELQQAVKAVAEGEEAAVAAAAPATPAHLRIYVSPEVLERLRDEDEQLLIELEQRYGRKLSFRADETFRADEFRIVDVASGDEVR